MSGTSAVWGSSVFLGSRYCNWIRRCLGSSADTASTVVGGASGDGNGSFSGANVEEEEPSSPALSWRSVTVLSAGDTLAHISGL